MANAIMPYIAKALSSKTLKTIKQQSSRIRRVVTAQQPTLNVFIRIDDPYSYLLVQVLPGFLKRFNIKASFHTVLEMDSEMFPALDMWREYAKKDAGYLAELYKLSAPASVPTQVINNNVLSRDVLEGATAQLLIAEQSDNFLAQANTIFTNVWQNTFKQQANTTELNQPPLKAHLKSQLNNNQQLLKAKGHYFGAMIHFESEWYWGLDRLDHLEQRLIALKLAKNKQEEIHFNLTYKNFCQPPLPITGELLTSFHQNNLATQPLTMYWSARSPYSYLGLERAVKLANFYRIPLNIKPVLPMMMRGMNVPQTKKMYIFFDTKREADKYSLPYGFVADPLGAAVERCYALLDYATRENKLIEFLLSFSRGVNTQGIRAETDRGLKQIVERCNLDWLTAKKQLNNTHWKKQVDDNLTEMFTLGCWGVPSFRYGENSYWGQDRLGIIEQAILKNMNAF